MPAFTGHRRHHAGGRLISAVLILFCAVAAHAQLDEVVATVDRTLITRMDLRFHVLERRLYNPELWSVPDELIEKQVLTDAVHEQLLYRDLWKDGREPGDAEIKAAAESAWKRLEHLAGSPEAMQVVLARSNLRAADVRRWLDQRARRLWVIESEISNKIDPKYIDLKEPTPDEAAEVQLAQIFVKSVDPTSPEQWRLAQQRLLQIKGDIERGVITFEEAAAIYSDDALSAKNAGEIGWVSPQHLDASIRSALRELRIGGISAPVRGDEGWHLFQLLDMDTERRRELRRETQKLKQQLLARLLNEYDIILAPGYELEPLEPVDVENP